MSTNFSYLLSFQYNNHRIPLKNNFEMNRSLGTLFIFFPLLFLMSSDHKSLTFSKTKLQCLSNALTFPINL